MTAAGRKPIVVTAEHDCARTRKRQRPTRAYTRGFTPKDGVGCELKIREVPVALKRRVMAKLRREGLSLRGKLLVDLQAWVSE